MKVGEESVHHAKPVAGTNEELCLAAIGRKHATTGRSLESTDHCSPHRNDAAAA